MKTSIRRLLSLLLTLLMAFSLLPGFAAGMDIADLGRALAAAQQAYDESAAAFVELTAQVTDLEERYNKASKKKQAALEEQWLEAMAQQEAAYEAFVAAEEELTDLQAEHQALLLANDDLETLTATYEGRFAEIDVTVTVDSELIIHDLEVEIDGGERDQAAAGQAFLYGFLGKDLPLSIGDGKKDDIHPLQEAQQTSRDVVAALNSLVYAEEEEKPAAGPIIEPQAIADYIFRYGKLPDNFITKKEAQALGWDSSRNCVSDVAPGYSIGGDRFGNYEGLLPKKKGRTWYEADCYYTRGKRNAHRILFSNDGLVYYTDDHYETFTQMHPSK